MAGDTKRLPRTVRVQTVLDAAVQLFSVNGYHESSMDAIAAQAAISKPMLYLQCGSEEELFGACLNREQGRFVEFADAVDLNGENFDEGRTLVAMWPAPRRGSGSTSGLGGLR
jgi:AcrR family transcriptional regulator